MQDEIALMPLKEFSLEESEFLMPNQAKWDFVLVCDNHKPSSEKHLKKMKFLEELHKKGFIIKTIEDKKLFYGVYAPSGIFQKYQSFMRKPESESDSLCAPVQDEQQQVPATTRIRVVNFILQNTEIYTKEKLKDLIKKKVFETAFPLHEKGNTFCTVWSSDSSECLFCWEQDLKTRRNEVDYGSQSTKKDLVKLAKKWARWRDILYEQPIEQIRAYFGEKVSLYFAWLGWYTWILMPATVPGIILLLYGFINFNSSQVSIEVCAANTTIMCPLCDQKCPFWPLSETCIYAKVTQLLDNEATVAIAILMALWATVFLELWKRQRASVVSDWNLYWWDEDEEELALELINNPEYTLREHQHSFSRRIIVLLLFLLMILVLIGIAHALVIYRVLVTVIFTQSDSEFIREQATTLAVLTGAVLHYLTIIIMSKVNRHVALFLCDFEKPRTFSEHENIYTVKIFILQFFTHFSSLIYIAFFLGRINGRPGNYVRIAGKWRLEECHPSGCITDLFIQMVVILTLKQTLSNCFEYLIPWLTHKYRQLYVKPISNSRVHMEERTQDPCKDEWLWNYQLNEVNIFSLFDEFLEMMIQYSFTTIFVAAFPLAPLMALISNIVEIRLDAIKMVRLQRRMVPRKANDIGIWLHVLEGIGILAVIGNGLVIAITSDFIPMQVYKYKHSPCTQQHTDIDCLTGYVNHSLSIFNVQDFENLSDLPQLDDSMGNKITQCRYRDYRNSDDYSYSADFWHIFAARLAFLILFEHVALFIKGIAAWYVPDVPRKVENEHLRKKYHRLLKELGEMDHSTDV